MKSPWRYPHGRPGWWPENEPWPPQSRHSGRMRGRFFRRIGCLFVIFTIFLTGIGAFFIWLLIQLLGLLQVPTQTVGWVVPLSVVLFVLGFAGLLWAGRSLRRMSLPIGDLLEAADRVANGDYSTRIRELGPPEVRSLAHAFNSMAARLQTADEQRRSLLADVTHELRTPLTIIQGNVEGMLDGIYATDEARLRTVLEETQILSRLVDDLRTLAVADAGTLKLNREPTDLSMLIQDTMPEFRSQFEMSGVELVTLVMPDPPLLNIDPERMRQILSNLISNAIRYTPGGGTVTIRFDVAYADGDPYAYIEVEDTGRGISAEDLPHIFDRFFRARDSGGMGLGLSIARQLVEAHNGSIQASSRVGEGTLIRISLPMD